MTITDDTCDPNEHLHPDKPTISIDEQNVLLRSELAKAEAELNFWHMLHEHTQLITRAEVLSRAVNQLVADASILEPEIERLKKIYLPD